MDSWGKNIPESETMRCKGGSTVGDEREVTWRLKK
jgi:hypothetical protein